MIDSFTDEYEFLGRGIKFPLAIGADGLLVMNTPEEQVRQSIKLILATGKGERVMRPDFGAGLERLAFEPLSPITQVLVQQQVREALTQYEPRIEVLDVTAELANHSGKDGKLSTARDGQGGKDWNVLLVNIQYRIRRTDSINNLVYPFYVERGEQG